jgi:glucose-6-phosphate dehydrogenase assembly protein OpcA
VSQAVQPGLVLARADAELRAMWATPPSPGEPPKARVCTMNLVVVAATPALVDECVAIVDRVLQGVPCRAIVVGLDPDGEDDIEATVSAVCTPAGEGGAVVCSERVTLVMRGALCGRLPSCVDALCATDVPMTLVWLARVRVEDPVFAPLAGWANRIVLETAQGSLSGLAHVVAWARGRARGEQPGIADLAWTRIAVWQELCARMFDEGRTRPLASSVTRVAVVQASAPGAQLGPEGALLLSWLATRLGWRTSSIAGKLRVLRGDGGHVQVQLRAELAPWAPRGALLAVEIDAAKDAIAVRGEVARGRGAEDDAGTWHVDFIAAGATQRVAQTVRIAANEPARILEDTLRRPLHDDALAEAVAWADELRGEGLVCG